VDELKSSMLATVDESTVIQSKIMRIAHLKVFWILKLDSTCKAVWINPIAVKTIAQQILNLVKCKTIASRIQHAQSS
jgi:hypothetical protein